MTKPTDDLIAELVTRVLEEQHRSGQAVSIEAACEEHPELADELRDAIEIATRLPELQNAALSADPLVGAVVGDRYRFDRQLGAGAMGVVWAAHDLELVRPVAIKVLAGALLRGAETIQRFEREAGALAAIRHESVVTVHDRGTLDDGTPFLVMERVEGVSLARILESEPPPREDADSTRWIEERFDLNELPEERLVRMAARWATELAAGLEVAHAAGVVHRDVKPSNVMIRPDGRAVLLDFGIAAVEGKDTLTRSDAALGTPAYMAPEMLAGRHAPRASQDVYGLGATLYHLVTSSAPYAGTPTQILTALATRDPVPAGRVRPGLPRDLIAILDAGLARSVQERYANVTEMREDLQSLLELRSVSVRPISSVTRSWRRVRRSKFVRGVLLALVAVSVVFGLDAFRDSRAKALRDARTLAQVEIPANLTVTIPANRRPALQDDVDAILDVLDRAVETRIDRVQARAIRASFRLDVGDREGAIADVGAIAELVDTDYARALAAAYVALPEADASAMDLVLDGLPEPAAALDHYLAGYHELRQLRRAEALAHLERDDLRTNRHARELAVLCMSLEIDRFRKRSERPQRDEAAAAMANAALELEEEFGWRSAMSRHLVASALSVQRSWTNALAVCEESNRLCDRSLVVRQNAAHAARMLGRVEDVREHVAVGLRLAPDYPPLHFSILVAEASAGNFEEALARTDDGAFANDRERLYAEAFVHAIEAQRLWEVEDSDTAVAFADEALARIEEADPTLRRSKFRNLHGLASAIREGDRDAIFLALLEQHRSNPISIGVLEDLTETFPSELPAGAAPLLFDLVRAVHDTVRAGALVAPLPSIAGSDGN